MALPFVSTTGESSLAGAACAQSPWALSWPCQGYGALVFRCCPSPPGLMTQRLLRLGCVGISSAEAVEIVAGKYEFEQKLCHV